jgi:hypothetical protein
VTGRWEAGTLLLCGWKRIVNWFAFACQRFHSSTPGVQSEYFCYSDVELTSLLINNNYFRRI